MPRPLSRFLATGVTAGLTAALLAGCGSDDTDGPAASGTPTTPARSASQPTKAVPQDEGGPLVALPDCAPPPEPVPADVPGLVVPDGTVITSVSENGPLVSVEGYVDLVPIAVRNYYQDRRGLELFEIEDEIFEAEALYGEGEFRSYMKARATCKTGSELLVVVGPAGTGGQPEVGGG